MKELTKEKRIENEYKKLLNTFQFLEEGVKNTVDGLIRRASFMKIALEDLEKIVNDEGVLDIFEQGDYSYNREHPALKSYNTTIKNYTSIIKTLCENLPKSVGGNEGEELLNFAFKKTK